MSEYNEDVRVGFLPKTRFEADARRLEKFLGDSGYRTTAHSEGVVLERVQRLPTWKVTPLSDQESLSTLDARWNEIFDCRADTQARFSPIVSLRLAADSHLASKEFGWFAWRSMQLSENKDFWTEALALHRDVLFPSFFESFPGGRVVAVTYDAADPMMKTLSIQKILQRAKRVGMSYEALVDTIGKDAKNYVGFFHPVYLLWFSLYFAITVFYPHVHGIVASLQNKAFLVYILPKSETVEDNHVGWFETNMPGLTSMNGEGKTTATGDIRWRTSPLGASRQKYVTEAIEAYLVTIVTQAEKTLAYFGDLTRYSSSEKALINGLEVPVINLDFAQNSIFTLFALLRKTIMMTMGNDPWQRRAELYDVLDLHAALMETNMQKAAEQFNRFAGRSFSDTVLQDRLRIYPGLVGSDLRKGLLSLRRSASRTIKEGVLYGRRGDVVDVEGRTNVETISLDTFEIRLLRSLRNTKHGFHIRDASYLSAHTGAIDEDFPDYALALFLGLLADPCSYTLNL